MTALQAFAVTTDPERQTAAWNEVGGGACRPSAWRVRALLAEGKVPGNAAVARFVGAKACEAAGGAIDRDLDPGALADLLRDAYDAVEAALVLFLLRHGPAMRRAAGPPSRR